MELRFVRKVDPFTRDWLIEAFLRDQRLTLNRLVIVHAGQEVPDLPRLVHRYGVLSNLFRRDYHEYLGKTDGVEPKQFRRFTELIQGDRSISQCG
jgi:hypothetical protein